MRGRPLCPARAKLCGWVRRIRGALLDALAVLVARRLRGMRQRRPVAVRRAAGSSSQPAVTPRTLPDGSTVFTALRYEGVVRRTAARAQRGRSNGRRWRAQASLAAALERAAPARRRVPRRCRPAGPRGVVAATTPSPCSARRRASGHARVLRTSRGDSQPEDARVGRSRPQPARIDERPHAAARAHVSSSSTTS